MDVIYSRTRLPELKDRKTAKAVNPVHFVEPDPAAKRVFLNGDFPEIAKAYEEAGVPVSPFSEFPNSKPASGRETKGA